MSQIIVDYVIFSSDSSKSCCCQETWIYENINCSFYLFPKILIFLISIIKPFPWSGSIFYWFLHLSNFSFLHPNWFIKFHPLPLVASFDFDCRFSKNICKSDHYFWYTICWFYITSIFFMFSKIWCWVYFAFIYILLICYQTTNLSATSPILLLCILLTFSGMSAL